jgi:hypothetical protein
MKIKIFPVFLFSLIIFSPSVLAWIQIAVAGVFSLVTHIAILTIQFMNQDQTPTNKTLQVTIKHVQPSDQASSQLKPANWPDAVTPPATAAPTGSVDTWADYPIKGGNIYANCTAFLLGANQLLDTGPVPSKILSGGQYHFYTTENGLESVYPGTVKTTQAFYYYDVNNTCQHAQVFNYAYPMTANDAGPHGSSTACPPGYTLNSGTSTCELTDPSQSLWPEDGQIAVDRIGNTFQCAGKDADCQFVSENPDIVISGDTVLFPSATDSSEHTQITANADDTTTITVQSHDPVTGENTGFTDVVYDSDGDMVGQGQGPGTSPNYDGPGGVGGSSGGDTSTGPSTSSGATNNCGGPGQPSCKFTLDSDALTNFPEHATVRTIDEVNVEFKSRIDLAPVSSALSNMYSLFSFSSAACPVFSIDLPSPINQTVSTTLHCDLYDTVGPVLSIVMTGVWIFVGFRIFASA